MTKEIKHKISYTSMTDNLVYQIIRITLFKCIFIKVSCVFSA